ncbi:MAG: hypothetical protein R3E08_10185 [Thiotrichaceae bacterium]
MNFFGLPDLEHPAEMVDTDPQKYMLLELKFDPMANETVYFT